MDRDLFGVWIREKKKKRKKGLGHLPKKELIAAVKEIFPNATVLPNIKLIARKAASNENNNEAQLA
jgi:hypothetical protein